MQRLEERLTLFIFSFTYFYQHGCLSCIMVPIASFTVLWPSTEIHRYWPPVSKCFIEKSILGIEREFSTPMKLFHYINIELFGSACKRNTHLVGGRKMHLKVNPLWKGLSQRIFYRCVMDTLSLGSSNYVEKCLMFLCHVHILYRFLRVGAVSLKHQLFYLASDWCSDSRGK